MRKRLAMLMTSLFLVMGVAWAQVAYTVDATTGSGVTSNGWSKNWSYTTTAERPAALKLLCNAANMQTRDNLLALYVGTTSPATYTLQVPNKYHIASYSFDFVKDGEYTNDVTLTVNGKEYKPTSETQSVSVENVNASSTSFVFSGANKGITVSNFVVNIVVAPIELTTDENNPKWYTIKNVRGNAYARYDGDGEAIKLYGDIADHAFLFYFTEGTTEGTYKIHNHVNNLLCAGTDSWTADGADWYIKTSGNTSYPGFAISTNADLTQEAAWNDYANYHTSVAVYDGNDAGSTWDVVRYEGEIPAIQLSTKGNIVLHYIRSIRRDSYVNFDGHNSTFKEGAQGLASYWYFVQDTEAQDVPEGFIACKIFNAAHATGVENHSSGFMGTDSWPARTYYIGFKENNRYGYIIRRSDVESNGWHDYSGTHVGDYGLGDDGSLWRIYPAGMTGAELMSEATTAKNNALTSIALYESADYYTYSNEAIATAKSAIEAINTAELHSAVAGITSIPAALATLQATEKGAAGPAAGDYIQLSNRNFGDYLSAVDNDDNKIRKMSDKTNLATLWKVEAGSAVGSVKLKNVGNGKYMGTITKDTEVLQVEAASAADLTFCNVTDVYAAFQTTGGNNYSFANYNSNWGGRILGWEKNDAASQWVMTQAYPLTVVYQFEGAELTDLRVEKVVEPGTVYTIENSDAFDGKTIKAVVGATDNGDGTWAVTVNAATTVTVTLGYEDTNLYALKSPTGTYFNFTAVVPEAGAAMTYASFQEEPSFLYKVAENNSYYFESMSTPGEYIGVGPSNAYWIVTKDNKALWNISAEDANGYVTISRSTDANARLGHDGNTNKGTGIFTNVGNTCFGWQLIPAYPITIIYKNSNDEVLETVNAATIAGTGYSFTIDTQGGTLVSCVADKGTMTETDGTYSFVAVNGATTVTVTLEDVEVPEAEPTNLYALKSPTGTYFSFIAPTDGTLSAASFQDTPTFFYKEVSDTGYTFEDMGTSGRFIGLNGGWNVGTTSAVWNISEADENGYVTISRSEDANSRLGHDEKTTAGTGIFTNVGANCNKWQIIPAYPITIIYKNSDDAVLETIKAAAIVGTEYSFHIDTKGGKLASCETDKGTIQVTDGTCTLEAVYGATTVTISIAPMGAVENPAAVVALVNRIGGTGTSNNFKFVHDPALNPDGETFEIGAEDSKILIKGSTISALTTGLGWYLNNIAHINIAWNSLNEKTTTVRWDENAGYADLSHLPIPTETETHTSDAKYRYYLNYCTFGYSMTSWTWTRWQQEIDWMALHGINMPLQIIGLEEVWRKFLTLEENGQRKYNYSDSEAKAFVAGPAFTAWWGMNNLEGWGGTSADGWGGVQDDAWYERQQTLATQILTLQRALGMQPVLPGFSGMVPSNFKDKTGVECNAGSWGGFTRPKIVLPSNARFAEIAADYYACLKEVMGESQYYSMDPFHEGDEANASKEAYTAIYNAMETAKSGSQWVIQQWQWFGGNQTYSLQGVPAGKLIVLDLFSDGRPEFDKYGYDGYDPQEAVFCAIPNFGGRSGLMGRLQNVTDNYFKYKKQFTTIKGIGAAPEAIEQTPVAYDLLYQLPWMNGVKPDVAEWVDNYAVARYGKDNAIVKEAWSLLRQGPLNYGADAIQGPVEDVWAARPNLDATPASSWGTTLNGAGGTYTPARRQMLIDAVYKLIDQEDELELANGSVYKSNYMYDLVEFGGAVMADYAYDLLLGIKAAKSAEGTNGATYKARRDAFLQLILDMDAFRGTNLNFRLGKWTQEARDAAVEAQKYGATTANEDWYEFNNARTILTTWGDQGQNGNGAWNNGLKDYSYRSWQGLLADYYYPRWKYYFDNGCTHPNGNAKNYFYFEWNWAHGMKHQVGDTQKSTTRLAEGEAGYSYARDPEGNTVEEAVKMLGKYIIPVTMADGTHYAYRYLTNDLSSKVTIIAMGGTTIDLTKYFGALEGATVTGEFIDGEVTDLANIAVKSDLTKEAYTGTITLADGTVLTFGVSANPKYYGAYQIKFNGESVFIQYHKVGDNAGNVGYKVVTTQKGNGGSTGYKADYEADKIFTIVPSGTGYALSAQGQYLKTTASSGWNHIMFSDQKGDAGTYTFTEAADLVKLKSTNTQGMASVAIFDNGAWGNDVDNKAIGFTIEEVTTYAVIVPEGGYLAVCLPFNVVLPAGMTAYDVTVAGLTSGDDGAITTLQAIATEGQILKAGTPALLKATANTYNLTITMENNEAKTSSHESKLRGNFVKQTLQPGTNGLRKFVLDAATGKFELLEAEQEIPANTCWIEAKIDAEHVEVTEHKGKIVKVDDWLFEYDDATNGIKLKDVATTGDGNLEIKETFTINGKTQKVVAITPDFLENNKDVTEITLPSSLVNLGFRKVIPMFETSYEGEKGDTATYDEFGELTYSQGMHRCLVFPNDPDTGAPFKVSKDFAWKLTLDVTIDRDSLSYNQWGSSIVSTHENSLADSYFGSMQIYMKKDLQHIVVKIDNADDRYSYSTEALDEDGNVLKTVNGADSLLVNRHFTFELEHDGSGGYQVVIYYDNGKAKMYNITASENNKVSDFDRLYYSLPEGIHVNVKFDRLTNEGLFVGCTNLKAIHVHRDNPTFSSCEHGVLYDKNKYYVMRIPEGETSHHFEIPSKVVKLYPGSIHGVSADIVLHSNPEIGVVEGHDEHVENARFFLSLDDKDNTITEKETGYGGARDFISTNKNTYQSGRYKRAPLVEGKYGTIVLPFAPTNWKEKYDFFKMTDADATSFHFSQVDELQPNTAYLYKLKENPGTMDMEGDTLDVFETEEVFTVQTHAKYNPNDETPGGFRALGAYVNYYIDTKNYPNTNYYTFSVSRQEFNRITKKLNYRPYRALFVVTPEQPGQAAQAPAKLSLRITRNDGSTTEIDPSQVEGMEAPIYYDLQGRRVENPTSGVYIVNGKKVIF